MPKKKSINQYHHPTALDHNYKKKTKKAVEYIKEDGMKVREAAMLVFGISYSTFSRWKKEALEDLTNGYTGTQLQYVIRELYKADVDSGRKLTRKARELALDDEEPNVEMLKFLLERRHGYRKQSKKDVEVSTADDFNFNINIVDSKKKE